MKRLIALWALLAVWAPGLRASAPAPLTSIQAIRALSQEQAHQELPADFQATVTYYRSYEKTLFVQQGDAGLYVNATTGLPLVPGDVIRIQGITRDSFRPFVISRNITLVHHGAVPPPTTASFSALIGSTLDCRYVTVHGLVRSATPTLSSGRPVSTLEIRMDGGSVSVTLDSSDPAPLKGLLDAEVAVSGASAGKFDGKMQQTGILLHVTSFDQVKVLRKPAADAWLTPLTPLDEVLTGYNVQELSKRVRIEGTLTYYHPSSMAVVQDGTKSIRIRTSELKPLQVGDKVEATGFPYVDNGFLTLKLGEIHSLGPAPHVVPRRVSWADLAASKYAFDLVSIDGTVVTQVREHGQDVYVISSGGNLFSATVLHPYVYEWDVQHVPPPMPEIRPGSKVRVTGVDILDDGNPFNGAMSFGILLRTAADITVLQKAPWINVRNLSLVTGALLLLVIAVAAWGARMKRDGHRQSLALAQRIEAEALLERRRSRILEDINGRRPLNEILQQIAALVAFNLQTEYCWIQMGDDAPIGKSPADEQNMKVMDHEIRSQSGSLHGTIHAAFDPRNCPPCSNATEALSMGTWLATLAIETRGLYTDLVHRSEFDMLTDLHNRFSLEKRLDAMLSRAGVLGASFGLIYVDLDGFKQINDRYGHRIGDLYLQAVALRMKHQLRPGDLLARLGGDEFAALVPIVRSRADVEEISLRMERCFDEPYVLEGQMLRGGASIGFALFPEDGKTKDELLSKADFLMYRAKNNRRNWEARMEQAMRHERPEPL